MLAQDSIKTHKLFNIYSQTVNFKVLSTSEYQKRIGNKIYSIHATFYPIIERKTGLINVHKTNEHKFNSIKGTPFQM